MIPTTFKVALCIVCYALIATCDIQLHDVEINHRQDDLMLQGDCPFIFSIFDKQIIDMENVIMKTLVDMNATLVTLKDSEEQQNCILIDMCVMEILSNRIDKAVSTFNLSGNELSISTIVGKIYVYGDLTLFELIVRFINKLEIKYTQVNGIAELYDLMIENDDFNIVNGIMLLNSVYASGKGGTQFIEKVLLNRLSQLTHYKDIELFFTFAKNFENDQLVLNMIPTFVSLIYAKSAKNIELVLELLNRFYYLNQKIYGTIALSKEIAVHKHDDENSALAVVYQIIHYQTLLGKHRLVVNNQPLMKMVEKSLPDNYLPFLYTDLCFLNKYYGRYLYVDSDDHVQHNLYRPISTRKIIDSSLMYKNSMKFGIHFQCREADCSNLVIESVLHQTGEILFAENGTVFTYKETFPDEKQLQAEWHLESDGKYFRLKNQEYGTFLQIDEIIEGGGYEIALKDIALDWDSDKSKWKIEKCQVHLNNDNECQKL